MPTKFANNEGYLCLLRFSSCSGKAGGTGNVTGILGILIDTIAQELRLPIDKLERIRSLVRTWLEKKRCTKREFSQ